MERTQATIASTRQVAPTMAAVEIETPPGFEALPGQFVRLGIRTDDADIEGFYTISSPDTTDTFEVTVDAGPENDLGRTLAERETGDRVQVAGPFGDAAYAGGGDVVVLAGGPGIGAAIAICQRAVDGGHDAALVYRGHRSGVPSQVADLETAGVAVWVVDPAGDPAELADAVGEALAGTDGSLFVFGYAGFVGDAKTAIRLAGHDPSVASISSFG